METRAAGHTDALQEQVKKRLSLDRFIHPGVDHIHAKEVISEISADFSSAEKPQFPPDLNASCRQIEIYDAFYIENKNLSLLNFNDLPTHTRRNSLEHAEACNISGYALSLDPTYQETNLFEEALETYELLEENANDENTRVIQLGKAFSLQHIGVTYFRQGRLEDAQDFLYQALGIQQPFLLAFPLVANDIAKSLHALAEVDISLNHFDAAKFKLIEAYSLENHLFDYTDSPHFFKFTMMYSLVHVLMHLKENETAIQFLTSAYNELIEIFKADPHESIAEMLHLMGDVFVNANDYVQALIKYIEAFKIKKKLFPENSLVIKVAQEAIYSVLHHLNQKFPFEWDNYNSIVSSKEKLPAIELVIKEAFLFWNVFDKTVRLELGDLLYKVGTFYNYVLAGEPRAADIALRCLTRAKEVMTNDALAWVKNHIGYTYHLKAIEAKKNGTAQTPIYSMQALDYCSEVIDTYQGKNYTPQQAIIYAFANYIKGLNYCEAGKLTEALTSYQLALNLYKTADAVDPHARALNQYAIALAKDGQHLKAKNAFEELKSYWTQNPNVKHPDRARFECAYEEYSSENTAPSEKKAGYDPKLFAKSPGPTPIPEFITPPPNPN